MASVIHGKGADVRFEKSLLVLERPQWVARMLEGWFVLWIEWSIELRFLGIAVLRLESGVLGIVSTLDALGSGGAEMWTVVEPCLIECGY